MSEMSISRSRASPSLVCVEKAEKRGVGGSGKLVNDCFDAAD